MEARIRLAQNADLAAWTRLRCELWPDCPAERHALETAQLVTGGAAIALAEVRDEIVGFAELSIRSDHVEGTSISPVPYLEGWYVSQPHRGRGIGKALVGFLEEWARSRGFRELASDAEAGNSEGIRRHRELGFREVGSSVHFVKTLMDD